MGNLNVNGLTPVRSLLLLDAEESHQAIAADVATLDPGGPRPVRPSDAPLHPHATAIPVIAMKVRVDSPVRVESRPEIGRGVEQGVSHGVAREDAVLVRGEEESTIRSEVLGVGRKHPVQLSGSPPGAVGICAWDARKAPEHGLPGHGWVWVCVRTRAYDVGTGRAAHRSRACHHKGPLTIHWGVVIIGSRVVVVGQIVIISDARIVIIRCRTGKQTEGEHHQKVAGHSLNLAEVRPPESPAPLAEVLFSLGFISGRGSSTFLLTAEGSYPRLQTPLIGSDGMPDKHLSETSRRAWIFGASAMVAGVALGAFGSHGLERVVSDPHLRDVWSTAVRYHQIHGVALCLVAVHPAPRMGMVWLFVAGLCLFSGSLYTLSLTGVGLLGAITPLGGVCFLVAWSWMAVAAARQRGPTA